MSRVTDEKAYRRRRFIAGALGLGALGGLLGLVLVDTTKGVWTDTGP